MDLAKVSGYTLSSPLKPPQDRPFHGGTRRLLTRDVVLAVGFDGTRPVATATWYHGVANWSRVG